MLKYVSDIPIWQCPVVEHGGVASINNNSKCHCFVENKSLCGRFMQDTAYYETDVPIDEIERKPGIACKKCYKIWSKRYREKE